MTAAADIETTLETIAQLADDIARTSPESADRAMRIVKLLRDLEMARPDRASIQDAIEAQTATDLSDVQLRNTTTAVVRSMHDDVGEGAFAIESGGARRLRSPLGDA